MADFRDADFREFVRIIQDFALRAYPNPERVGCPSGRVIHDVARRAWPTDDPVFQSHIVQCSPCIADLLAERTALQGRQKRRRRAIFAGAAAAGILVLLSIPWIQDRYLPYRDVPINLQEHPVFRGPITDMPQPPKPISIPAGRLNLKLTLPVGREPGHYEVAFFRNFDSPAFISTTGEAVRKNGESELSVRAKLNVSPGRYIIGIRKEAWAWMYYEFTLKAE